MRRGGRYQAAFCVPGAACAGRLMFINRRSPRLWAGRIIFLPTRHHTQVLGQQLRHVGKAPALPNSAARGGVPTLPAGGRVGRAAQLRKVIALIMVFISQHASVEVINE